MGVYRTVERPLFFALPAEVSHRVAGSLLRLPLPWALIGGATERASLETDLAGIRLRNPIGLAAGFDKACTGLEALGRLGFGYVVGGTVTRDPRKGNPKPRVARVPTRRALVNSMGLPNPGLDKVAGTLAHTAPTAPILVSLGDEAPADVAQSMQRLQPLVDGFELNVSSPNSPWRHSRSDNPGYLREVLAALAPDRTKPLFVKLPPFRSGEQRSEVLDLARIAVDGGAQGITCANTWPIWAPRFATGRGGLSGPELMAHTPLMVEALRAAIDVPINACGGIFTAADARRCLDAGANTVQVYTALIYEGPRLPRKLVRGLAVAESRPRAQD